MLIENSQKVNEWKVSLALVTWVTSSHFSPLPVPWLTREERNEDLTGYFEKPVTADQEKKNIHLQERKRWPGGEASSL